MFTLGDGRARPAHRDAVVAGDRYRFTVLTSRLIRMEWSETGDFVDAPTAIVTERAFDVPDFTVHRDGEGVTIRTAHLELHHDGRPFSPSGLSADIVGAPDVHYSTWRYGVLPPQGLPYRGNLGGTARTLDEADGEIPLEPGLLATYGFATLDDSSSVVLTADGWVAARPAQGHDLYLFAHGRDYQGALDDFFALTGRPALVPRYVLGNWWSRYWPYAQDEYLGLMDSFAGDRLPFSVAVIDMDWHITDVDPELGTGWTGYTWDPDLFPDPPAMLDGLHERGLAVTLNLHPADGVRRHEAAYPDMARALGVDPSTGDPLAFDVASQEYVDAYLTHLHHPLEREGVDFWWLDWQSGGHSRVAGLDPLWMLNHVHFTDSGRDGRRPLTFSRFSGPGSHRYPIGFSGDTVTTWASLDFQPRFTASAANIGYFWWSHDIGGHMWGVRDPELTVRWVQFGVFSPVNRLHSSSSAFASKDPRLLGPEAGAIAARFLRLRHLLVPYLYTAAWAAHAEGVALVRPLYHAHPDRSEAYQHPNTYLLGPDLLVAPITAPCEAAARVGRVTAWLPEGVWVDLFTGDRYRGGRTVTMHRPVDTIPVLAREGAVLPFQDDALAAAGDNPARLALRVIPGDGVSELVEDDGSAAAQPWRVAILQRCAPREDGALDLTVELTTAEAPGRPLEALAFDLAGITSLEHATVEVDGAPQDTRIETASEDVAELLAGALRVECADVDLHRRITLHVVGARRDRLGLMEGAEALLHRAHIEYEVKDRALAAVRRFDGLELADELGGLGLHPMVRDAILELALARSVHA